MSHSDFRDWVYDELEKEQKFFDEYFGSDLEDEDDEDEEEKPL